MDRAHTLGGRPARRRSGPRRRACAAAACAWVAAGALGQPSAGPPDGGLAPSVQRVLEAPYLTPEERRDLRVFHGVWEEEDLDTPARRARAALSRGALLDPALDDPAIPAEDRAEARLERGDPAAALAALGGADSVRAHRIRAQALEALGRAGEADAAVEPVAALLALRPVASAGDLVDAALALMVRERVRGPSHAGAGSDYRAIVDLLGRARTQVDQHYWPAHAAEAWVLWQRDNREQAQQAAREAIALNPRCARAWGLLGRLAVDSFEFEAAQEVARRLEDLAGGPTPDAAAIRARAQLRQGDAAGAEEFLAPALAAYPAHRGLLALQAAAAARRFDFARADELLAALDARAPGTPDGVLEVGSALSEARQYEASARYLDEAARRAPNRPEAFVERGLMEMQAGRDDEALPALERAVELDPFHSRARNTLQLVRDLQAFGRVESEHFAVRFRPGADEVLAREMLPVLEAIHARVCGSGPGGIDHEPAGRTLIDLMPDHRWFAVRIAGITEIHTMAAATGPVIAMEAPRTGPGHRVGEYDWPRVLQHEYTHTVTLSRTRNRIPHWFTEAAAVYLEDAPRDFDACRLLADALAAEHLFDLDEINIAFVRPRRPTDRAQAYAQGHWMYEYIVLAFGARAPLDLMDLYAQGVTEPEAFARVLGVTPDEFLDAFRGWARAQVVAWGLLPRDGEPALIDLLKAEPCAGEARAGAAPDGAGAAGPPAADPILPEPTPEMVERWLADYPDHPQVLELAVTMALAAHGGEPAREMIPLLHRCALARPVDPTPHKLLARLYLDGAGDGPTEAIPHLEFLDAREQYSAAYAVELARLYWEAGDAGRAKAKAERAVRIAPFDADYRELAASIGVQARDWAMGERHIRALIAIEPDREVHRRRLDALEHLRSRDGG